VPGALVLAFERRYIISAVLPRCMTLTRLRIAIRSDRPFGRAACKGRCHANRDDSVDDRRLQMTKLNVNCSQKSVPAKPDHGTVSVTAQERVMRCWNCGRKVTKRAKICGHCEADCTEAPSAEEAAVVMELLEQMPPEVLAELGEAMSKSGSAEGFANLIMVGPCPSCGSEQSGDCDADPEINELLAGTVPLGWCSSSPSRRTSLCPLLAQRTDSIENSARPFRMLIFRNFFEQKNRAS
jgi:hypothetical protein